MSKLTNVPSLVACASFSPVCVCVCAGPAQGSCWIRTHLVTAVSRFLSHLTLAEREREDELEVVGGEAGVREGGEPEFTLDSALVASSPRLKPAPVCS